LSVIASGMLDAATMGDNTDILDCVSDQGKD
jgi:hypothetical protein